MNREQIEKVALESCVIDKSIYNDLYQPYYMDGFIAGAEWRIDNVWNKPSSTPKMGVFILAEDERIGNYSIYKLTGQSWEEMVEDFYIIRWAYIDDLIPDKED